MKRPRLRSILSTTAFLILIGLAWSYLAPTSIGGSTRYVTTGGTSMEPRFHTGDLGIVRPASHYKVGEIVAYWSTMLHTVVLHRIHAMDGNRYVFKGDNNNFLDPIHPTRSELLGKLWLHVPRGGVWLGRLHSPIGVAVIVALFGVTFLGFGEQQRRRRKRRRKDAPGSLQHGIQLVSTSSDPSIGRRIDFGAFLTASAVAAAVFVVLAVVAFSRPTGKLSPETKPYTQQVSFGYSAKAHDGPVYPTGAVKSGDPIFLSLVHQLNVNVNYNFVSAAAHDVVGSEEVLLKLSSQTGWSRTLVLTPRTRFTGDHTSTVVTLGMPEIESLLAKVSALTGSVVGGYAIAVEPRVHITGTVASHPLNLTFDPAMNFILAGQQLVPQGATATGPSAAGGAPSSGGSTVALTATRPGAVGTPVVAPATISVLGVSPKVSLLRWISIIGLVLSALAAAFLYLRKRAEPFDETLQIQSQFGHMIVPIVGGEDLGWPPVDVPSIKALVMLAESGQRLILHNRSNDVDTYMVNEEGTVYRYQVKPSKVVWGDWSDNAAPVKAAA